MVVNLVLKLSRQVQMGRDSVSAKNKVNVLVTASHMGVTLAYTIAQSITFFHKDPTQQNRMNSAFYFFGGLADIFLSVMLWFIFDS
jgi:hypothetical protein